MVGYITTIVLVFLFVWFVLSISFDWPDIRKKIITKIKKRGKINGKNKKEVFLL